MYMKRYLIFAIAVLFCVSCGKGNDGHIEEEIERGTVLSDAGYNHATVKVSAILEGLGEAGTKTVEFAEDLGTTVCEYNTNKIKEQLKYDVDSYIIDYSTVYGLPYSIIRTPDAVRARALILVPKRTDVSELPLAVYFHGTVLPVPEITDIFDMGTPADFTGANGSQDVRHCALPLASAGYCVICPEYTGYGPTSGRDHPFVYYPELWQSAYDSMVAGYKFLTDPKYGIKAPVTRNVWLTGWSQGGGMALYAQRELEGNPDYMGMFKVKATSTLAGPFNMTRFLTDMLKNKDKVYLLMALYGWAGYAINMFAPELQRPMDQIFRPCIYDQTDAFVQFGNTPADLFQEFFISNILNGSDTMFLEVLEKDSTYKLWTPGAPVFMHHGLADNVVPYFNSEDAYKGLRLNSPDVHLNLYIDKDHTNFVPSYISKTIEQFSALQ